MESDYVGGRNIEYLRDLRDMLHRVLAFGPQKGHKFLQFEVKILGEASTMYALSIYAPPSYNIVRGTTGFRSLHWIASIFALI